MYFEDDGCLRPVERAGREDRREGLAVSRVRAAVEQGQDVLPFLERARHDRPRYRRGEEIHQHGAVGLEALVGLDAALGLVAVIDNGRLEGVALDAAPGVDERKIVALALAVFGSDERIDLGEILGEAQLDHLFLGPPSGGRAGKRGCACQYCK